MLVFLDTNVGIQLRREAMAAGFVNVEVLVLNPDVCNLRTREGRGHHVRDGKAVIARPRVPMGQEGNAVLDLYQELLRCNPQLREDQVKVLYPMSREMLRAMQNEVRDAVRQYRIGAPKASRDLKIRLIRIGHVDATQFGLPKQDWQMSAADREVQTT